MLLKTIYGSVFNLGAVIDMIVLSVISPLSPGASNGLTVVNCTMAVALPLSSAKSYSLSLPSFPHRAILWDEIFGS
jgi:hypothetical protein